MNKIREKTYDSKVNLISEKKSVNRAGGLGGALNLTPLRFLSSREHLDWFKTDLNAAEIIIVQDYKCE